MPDSYTCGLMWSMPTYEMFWDCRSCGSTKLLGRTHRHCPNCGQVQDPAWRYFPSEDEKIAVEDHVFVGVDWVCERCDTPNAASAAFCVNCGDARDGVEKDVTLQEAVLAGAQKGEREIPKRTSGFARPEEPSEPEAPSQSLIVRILVLAFLIGIPALVLLLALAFCWTRDTEVRVTGHSWERTVGIERLEATSSSDWCDRMPRDAYSVSRSQRKRDTRKIRDGETCRTVNRDNGDGTFSTRQSCSPTYRYEDVYDAWCSYSVDRWRKARSAVASGKGLSPAPTWPDVRVDGCSRRGCTRRGARRGSYFVHLVDGDGEKVDCDLDEGAWSRMTVGSRWKAQKRVLLDNVVCRDFEPLEAR